MRYVFSVAVVLFFLVRFSQSQETKSRIYIANDDHTDLMWTANVETYSKAFVEMLNFHLKLADETAANDSPYRNRFNCDGSYWLWCYQQSKTPAEFEKLVARIKDGTVSVPLNAVVSCYGGQPAEAVFRGMYYPGRLERKFGLRFPLAVAMENQTLPLGLTSLFAGAGAKYSWRGVCGCGTKMDLKSLGDRSHEVFWWTGHDGQRLLLKWHSLVPPGNKQSGGYAEAFDPVSAIRFLDADGAFLKRYRGIGMTEPYRVRGAFGFGWDALNRKTGQPYGSDSNAYPTVNHFHEIAKEMSNSQRQVYVSNEIDFFEDFEKNYGSQLESESVTYGNEWDLYSASMSETSARVKRAVERLRTAELLALLVSLKSPGFMDKHIQARDLAFNNLGLYWEHNWTADGPISRKERGAWQESLASQIESFVQNLQDDAIKQLGWMIAKPSESARFFVFNSLGWNRTDVADFAYSGPVDLHVIDVSSGKVVPHQFIYQLGQCYLRILAADVPSAGYKVYEIQEGTRDTIADETPFAALINGEGDSVLENEYVKLVVERDGAISSLVDKTNGGVEMAQKVDGLWLNDIAANSDEGSAIRIENNGPVSVSVIANSKEGIDHSSAITLFRGSRRIDIQNTIHSNFSDVRHWGFSFALEQPNVFTEEIGSINLNKLKSAGGDYSDRHARYDYVTVNHFLDLTNGKDAAGITLSNPDLAFGKLGSSTYSKLDADSSLVRMLAGGQVDGKDLGIPLQNGNAEFHQSFSLRPHGRFDAAVAMRFAMEHQNPLLTESVNGKEIASYETDRYSLIQINNPNVLVWALKVHEDGIERGLTTRLWNVSSKEANAKLEFQFNPIHAWRTTHIETDLVQLPLTSDHELSIDFAHQQIQTLRIEVDDSKVPLP